MCENVLSESDARVKIIRDNILETSRWSEIHDLVFEYDGKLYQTTYSQGSTESQDESPFEYDDVVTCDEVETYQEMVTNYRKIDND